MQYELQSPRRTSMPVLCPSCGEVVSAIAPTCAVCGFANPGAQEQSARSCDTCDAKLGPGSRFCRNCGAAVGLVAVAPAEPPDVVVPMAAPAPVVVSEPQEQHRPLKYLTYDDFEGEVGDFETSSHASDSLDYLDAQLGLKAPEPDPTLRKPPAWRQARGIAAAEEVRHVPPKTSDVVVHTPVAPVVATRRSDGPSMTVQVTVGFALFALLLAMLIHLVAPNAIPGFSAAEVDLKVQMRAIEWLLAGVLVALVGLLLKR